MGTIHSLPICEFSLTRIAADIELDHQAAPLDSNSGREIPRHIFEIASHRSAADVESDIGVATFTNSHLVNVDVTIPHSVHGGPKAFQNDA